MKRLWGVVAFYVLVALAVQAQDSPFGRKKRSGENKDRKAKVKRERNPAPDRGEPVEISGEDLEKALADLDAAEDAARRAAFDRLYKAHEDSKTRGRLKSLLSQWERAYKDARQAAVDKLQPAGGDLSSLRQQAEGLLKQGNTKAMQPIVDKMFKMKYPDTESANADAGVRDAESRLREYDRWVRWVGDKTKRNIDETISKISVAVDEPAILSHVGGEAASVMAGNRGARNGLSPEEYKLVFITNMYRAMMGRNALRINMALCGAAKGHSRDMKEHGFFAHESPIPGKRTPSDRARAAGTSGGAENIYQGSTRAWDAFWAWFLSLGHHRNMMAPHRQIGIGTYERFWTEMF